jgi:predicted Zn finger-like uncharacterized protein
MYTQCPDCGTSFRVTAVVLKQAAGKVRCGGCGNAFNALAYLSEAKPSLTTRVDPDGSLPELTPELVDTESTGPSTAISPEQSAALLKTLDQLAGEEIRLEDTGIEWRVLDDDDEDEVADDPGIDELLERTPTRVDQFLTKTPTEVEAGEIFEDPSPSVVEAVEVFEGADEPATQTSAEELRFDDNTGLPEDFDFDSVPARRSTDPQPLRGPAPEPESMQVDLAFGDPDEWGELLDEVAPEADDAARTEEPDKSDEADADAVEEAETKLAADSSDAELTFEAELATINDSDVKDKADEAAALLDIDTQFGMQAEAMGIDLSGMHKQSVNDEDKEEDDLVIDSETEEKTDAEVDEETEEDAEELVDAAEGAAFPDSTGALEFEISKAQEAAAQLEKEAAEETSIDDDLMSAAFENEKAMIAAEQIDSEEEEDVEEAEDISIVEDLEETDEPDLPAELDGKFDESIESLEIRLDDEDDDGTEESAAHFVPPLSEEEQTINMQIDADLLSMAIEDEDGFASTIVIEDKNVESKGHGKKKPVNKKTKSLSETSSGFETIIMEGESVRSAMEQKALAEAEKAGGGPAKPAFVLPKEEPSDEGSGGKRKYAMVAGIVVLALILAGQFVHQSRTALAKVPIINEAIGPLYRAIGAPITPDWDVKGWRIEVTKGSTNPIGELINGEAEATDVDAVEGEAEFITDEDETLTIYSRIGNQSDGPLPYPLVSVALTTRFEKIIGNKVLEPHEYLTGNLDPRVPVPPGDTFNAVISIEAPSAEVTGFRLNVCYRQDGGLLRCAIENFK